MGMVGSFLSGVVVGIAALGTFAGIYCNFFNSSSDVTENFSSLEKRENEVTSASVEEAIG